MSVIGLILGLGLIGLFGWLLVTNIIGLVKNLKERKKNKIAPMSVVLGEDAESGKDNEDKKDCD